MHGMRERIHCAFRACPVQQDWRGNAVVLQRLLSIKLIGLNAFLHGTLVQLAAKFFRPVAGLTQFASKNETQNWKELDNALFHTQHSWMETTHQCDWFSFVMSSAMI